VHTKFILTPHVELTVTVSAQKGESIISNYYYPI